MIDVIIPAYNAEKFIIDAIKSVENQMLKPHALFVVDDGSTDNTGKIVQEYKGHCSIPLTYIVKENGGPNSARNAGLAQSTAEYVAFLDADDTWAPEKLEHQMSVFGNSQFPNLGMVYGGYDSIKENGEKDAGAHIVPLDKNVRGSAFIPLLAGNKILGSASSVLIKRSVFDTVGTFDESLHFGEDWDMWLRIAEKYDVDFVNEPLVHVRRHAENQTNALDNVFLGEIDFFNKWTERISGKYQTPKRWADQIAFHIVIKLGRPAFIRTAFGKLSPEAKKMIFRSTGGSALLYTFLFCIKKIFSPSDWSRVLRKIKSYA